MAFEIESGIPMPDGPERSRASKYRFNEMNIGDSFVLSEGLKNPKQVATIARKRCWPKLFRWGRDEKGVSRVWRTA